MKPQSYTYSPHYPVLQYNATQANFYGGNFYDLRATGYKLMSPDSKQAQGPVVDTQEMGFPDFACVVFRLSKAVYRPLFEGIWRASFAIRWPFNTERICSTAGGSAMLGGKPTPVNLTPVERGIANATFDAYAHSLTAYKASPDVSAFSSKFEASLAGNTTLTVDEKAGYDLFRGKANCNSCHLDGRGVARTPDLSDNSNATDAGPLFTDTTSANLGLPKNPAVPFYYETTRDSLGFTPNPVGFDFTDLGVGRFLRGGSDTNPNANWRQYADKFDGFMQVATLRNVDMRPCPAFPKSYMHMVIRRASRRSSISITLATRSRSR